MTLDPAVAPQRHKIKPMLNQATETQILNQVRRAITLNRIAGYHFCGNFLDLRFEDVRQGQALVSLRAGPHLRSPDGQIHASAFAVLADFAMASAIRTADDPSSRLATVSINLQCNGTQAFDYLNAHGELVGFHRQGKGRLGQSTVKIYSEKGLVASGLGSFMALPAPKDRKLFPIAWINQAAPSHPVLVPDCEFDQSELEILEHARDCLDWCASLGERADHYFFEHFIGHRLSRQVQASKGLLPNGPHLGNRVGHVQGGITLGFGMASASASLDDTWRLSSLHAAFISPGQGEALLSASSVTHQGNYTAAVQTSIHTNAGVGVLELLSSHIRSQC